MNNSNNNSIILSSKFQSTFITYSPPPNIFQLNGNNKEVIKVTNDGDVYIKGKLITNDEDIVRYLKKISLSNYKENLKTEIRSNPQLYDEIVMELRKEKIKKLLNK